MKRVIALLLTLVMLLGLVPTALAAEAAADGSVRVELIENALEYNW